MVLSLEMGLIKQLVKTSKQATVPQKEEQEDNNLLGKMLSLGRIKEGSLNVSSENDIHMRQLLPLIKNCLIRSLAQNLSRVISYFFVLCL